MERLQRNKGTAKEEIRHKKGDKVWLNTKNIRTRRPAKKLDDRNAGPFVISQVISSHAYRIELPKTMRIHNVFHADLLSPFKKDTFGRFQGRPPPIITDEGEEQYEVERIIGWKQEKDQLYYEVKWRGYDSLENTMERAEKIAELDQVMREFVRKHPKAPIPKTYKKEDGKASNLSTSSPTTATATTTTTTTTTPPPFLLPPWSSSSPSPPPPAREPAPAVPTTTPPPSRPPIPTPGSGRVSRPPPSANASNEKDTTSRSRRERDTTSE